MGHIVGRSRVQMTMFPESLEELVPEDHVVRVIDGFVDSLDLLSLGFDSAVAEATGRPGYDPADLLKLYVYGYYNQLRSSRKLARETKRNIELLWLTNRLTPCFKTIADFRKDYGLAIVQTCRTFTSFCREIKLIGGEILAIDGSKLQAVASRKKVITPDSLAKQLAAIEAKVKTYLDEMDASDAAEAVEGDGLDAKVDVKAALAKLKQKKVEIEAKAKFLADNKLTQHVTTEPEARLMRTAQHGHQVAYNAQTVVDAANKLIVAFDLVNDGNDFQQLHAMALAGKQAVGQAAVDQAAGESGKITVVADAGYSNGKDAEACARDGIVAIVPRPMTANPKGEDLFSRNRFTYDKTTDAWQCPAGETLGLAKTSHTEATYHYRTPACFGCKLKAQCSKGKQRTIIRSFYEDAREAMHKPTTQDPKWMVLRRSIVEHPFAGIKWLMGHPRFLMRGLQKAKSELALSVLAYNMKRSLNILGTKALLQALKPHPA